MKDFSNASFAPEAISIMKDALDAAVASLPDPVSSAHVQSIAETHSQGRRKRPGKTAKNGVNGTSDRAPLVTGALKPPR